MFEAITDAQRQLLAPLFVRASFAAGQVVFTEKDAARHLYLIEEGELLIRVNFFDGGSMDVATIRPGGLCGWSSVLGRPHYTAAGICVAPARALVAPGRAIRRIIHDDRQLGRVLVERMARIAGNVSSGLSEQLLSMLEGGPSETATAAIQNPEMPPKPLRASL